MTPLFGTVGLRKAGTSITCTRLSITRAATSSESRMITTTANAAAIGIGSIIFLLVLSVLTVNNPDPRPSGGSATPVGIEFSLSE